MAKNFLNSILTAALKTTGGTAKKKTTTAAAPTAGGTAKKKMVTSTTVPTVARSSAQPKTAAEVAKNLSPKMKAELDRLANKPIPTPEGWTRTNDVSYSSG